MAQQIIVAEAYSLTIEYLNHYIAGGDHKDFPNIFTLTVYLNHTIAGRDEIGYIKVHILDKRAMEAISPSEMWSQCWAYDNYHSDTKLNKVENFLANESFPRDYQARIDEAKSVLYIEEPFIEPQLRRKGLSLFAVELLIRELGVMEGCVVMLQAGKNHPVALLASKEHMLTYSLPWRSGSIVRLQHIEAFGGIGTEEASDRLTKHWKQISFLEWSDSDDAWLCLWTSERPKISDVVPGLFREG